MNIEMITDTKTEAEFIVKGERHTFPGLLRDALLQDPKVDMAAYKLAHPMDEDSLFIVKTSGKTPKKALQEAVKKMNEELDQFQSTFKKVK